MDIIKHEHIRRKGSREPVEPKTKSERREAEMKMPDSRKIGMPKSGNVKEETKWMRWRRKQ